MIKLNNGKWGIKGIKSGWIVNKTFRLKWKAEIALEVFKNGGRISDYWIKSREEKFKREERFPLNVMNQLEEGLKVINEMDPTPEEIEEFARENNDYGVVTISESNDYFPPRIHNTWLT